MLSDEEKETIEQLRSWREYIIKHKEDINKANDIEFYLRTAINLIEKQSKEIEELKNGQIDFWMSDKEIEERIRNKFISKDKIKEILGIEEDIDNEKLLSLLQTIVDENVRLEEIEDRKVQIEYNNVFNKGVKSVEDKIKAKIEEIRDIADNGANAVRFAMTHDDEVERIQKQKDIGTMIEVLQSLLEKE